MAWWGVTWIYSTVVYAMYEELSCYGLYGFLCALLGDKGKIQKLVQMAWTFVNDRYKFCLQCKWMYSTGRTILKLFWLTWRHTCDFFTYSLATSLSLRKRPEILAVAHLNLAGKLANFDLKASTDSPSSKPWWYSFNKECQELVVEGILLVHFVLFCPGLYKQGWKS